MKVQTRRVALFECQQAAQIWRNLANSRYLFCKFWFTQISQGVSTLSSQDWVHIGVTENLLIGCAQIPLVSVWGKRGIWTPKYFVAWPLYTCYVWVSRLLDRDLSARFTTNITVDTPAHFLLVWLNRQLLTVLSLFERHIINKISDKITR